MRVSLRSLLLTLSLLAVSCSPPAAPTDQPKQTGAAGKPKPAVDKAPDPPPLIGEVFAEGELPSDLLQALDTSERFVPAAANPGEEMTWNVPVFAALLPSSPSGDQQAFLRAANTPKSPEKLYARLHVEVWRDLRKNSDSAAPGSLEIRVAALANPPEHSLRLSGPVLVVETGNPLSKDGADYQIRVGKIWRPEAVVEGDELTAHGGPTWAAETWLDVVVHAEIGGVKRPLLLRQVKVRKRK